jgi:hypothetical protein
LTPRNLNDIDLPLEIERGEMCHGVACFMANDMINVGGSWPSIMQVIKSCITNLPRKIAEASRLLKVNQKHWSVENRLHHRRDVRLGEDASQTRMKGAPQTLAVINSGILALMDYLGVKNVASQRRHFDYHYQEAIQLLLGQLKRQDG